MTPEQLKELVLAAPVLGNVYSIVSDVTQPIQEITYAQLQPGNTPCSKVFAVYVRDNYEATARLFTTNTGARSYINYLRNFRAGDAPTNLNEWGWSNLEEILVFRNKHAL